MNNSDYESHTIFGMQGFTRFSYWCPFERSLSKQQKTQSKTQRVAAVRLTYAKTEQVKYYIRGLKNYPVNIISLEI